MIKRKIFESNYSRVPKTEEDLLNLVEPRDVNSFRAELNRKPFSFDYGSSSFKAIGYFIEEYFHDQMKSIRLGSWELHDYMFDDNWVFFEYKNRESKYMTTRIGFTWNVSRGLDVYAEVNDVDFDIPEANEGLIKGFGKYFPLYRGFSSQYEYLIAICKTIADNDSKVMNFVKKVLLSVDKELRNQLLKEAYKEMSRLYADYKSAYNHYLELGGDEDDWENSGKHRIDSAL